MGESSAQHQKTIFDFDIVECLPSEINREIFSYLPTNELLSLSLVSKDWYSFIATECMKKIFLQFTYRTLRSPLDTPSQELKTMLIDSKRKYENVKFSMRSHSAQDVHDILKARKNWKKVHLSRIVFDATADCICFFSAFESTVQELKLDRVEVHSLNLEDNHQTSAPVDDLRCDMTFPKLKSVETRYLQLWMYRNVLANCTKLASFDLSSAECSGSSIEEEIDAIHKMLQRNKNLKKLSIVSNDFQKYFDSDISQGIEFRLTSFTARHIYNLTETQILNLKKFLLLQMISLTHIEVHSWPGLEVTKMMFHMPNLRKLSFRGFLKNGELVDWKNAELHRNLSITELCLTELYSNKEILGCFFAAAPNVKTLTLYTVNDETLNIINAAFPDLESLSTDLFEAANVSDKNLLVNLKSLSTKVFLHNLRGSNDNDEKGNFEKIAVKEFEQVQPLFEGKPRCFRKHSMKLLMKRK